MPRALSSESITADNRGQLLIGSGLAIVLAAQLWPSIPLAAAIAVIGWGATLTLNRHHHNEPLLALNLVVYFSLAGLAILAELSFRSDLLVLIDVSLALVLSLSSLIYTTRSRQAI